MGEMLNIISSLHNKTKRNYLARMMNDKIASSKIARKFDRDYWDGDRRFGYGGYQYDGRWEGMARKLIDQYKLSENTKILDVGCGKGYLLYEFQQLLPQVEIWGCDISEYALENAKKEVKNFLFKGRAQDAYPFEDKHFNLVISVTTLHNIYIHELKTALQEIERVAVHKYVVVESYRNEKELFNLQCWALTCNTFFTPEEWKWFFKECFYTGDYEFIFFE